MAVHADGLSLLLKSHYTSSFWTVATRCPLKMSLSCSSFCSSTGIKRKVAFFSALARPTGGGGGCLTNGPGKSVVEGTSDRNTISVPETSQESVTGPLQQITSWSFLAPQPKCSSTLSIRQVKHLNKASPSAVGPNSNKRNLVRTSTKVGC